MGGNNSFTDGDIISDDKMGEECGVFGIYDPEKVNDLSSLTYLGLLALQHRGQESAGLCINDKGTFRIHKAMGLVENVFDRDILETLKGEMAIGHIRYSTTGSSLMANVQPLLINCIKGDLAIAHNGHLINGEELRKNLESNGSIFHSTLDTEVVAHLVARSFEDNMLDALLQSLHQLKGGFSIVAMTEDSLIAARDPYGIRPLVLGKIGNGYVVASETCSFGMIGAEFVRDIEPGEVV